MLLLDRCKVGSTAVLLLNKYLSVPCPRVAWTSDFDRLRREWLSLLSKFFRWILRVVDFELFKCVPFIVHWRYVNKIGGEQGAKNGINAEKLDPGHAEVIRIAFNEMPYSYKRIYGLLICTFIYRSLNINHTM